MLKKTFCLLLVLFCLFGFVNSVKAEGLIDSTNVQYKLDGESGSCPILGDPKDDSSTAAFLQSIFNIIKLLGPILCVVLIIIDLVKAVASQDKDALAKVGKTSAKRVGYALVIFLLPTLIDFVFNLLGWYGTCGIN